MRAHQEAHSPACGSGTAEPSAFSAGAGGVPLFSDRIHTGFRLSGSRQRSARCGQCGSHERGLAADGSALCMKNGCTAGHSSRVARIIAVADCFDAMYSNRSCRSRMRFDKAVSVIREISGTQLTSAVAEAFLRPVARALTATPATTAATARKTSKTFARAACEKGGRRAGENDLIQGKGRNHK